MGDLQDVLCVGEIESTYLVFLFQQLTYEVFANCLLWVYAPIYNSENSTHSFPFGVIGMRIQEIIVLVHNDLFNYAFM